MLRKIEIDALKADLAAIENLLLARTSEEDPIGYFQFSQRKEELESKLSEMVESRSERAGVALYFGGRPTVGSRGIIADFGAKALSSFQDVISTMFATLEGPVGSRGPVRQRDRSQMLLTDAVRGSFGFILEEPEATQLSSEEENELKGVVQEVVDLIYRTAEPGMDEFDEIANAVDDRVLTSIRGFFHLIDEAGATLRLVERERDFLLQRDQIERARLRIDNMSVEVRQGDFRGRLYIVPASRKFELHISDDDVLKGFVTTQCLQQITISSSHEIRPNILGQILTVKLEVRQIELKGQASKFSYKLLEVYNEDSAPNLFRGANFVP